MGGNRSRFADCGEACPAEQVSWEDAQLFLDRLSKVLGKRYRLPTEAEWEYAARGGSESAWPAGESAANLAEYAWFNAVSARRTHPVGSKLPNAFGLFDMSGNVWEWVEDVWHDSYANAPTDGSAWVVGGDPDRRVVRGGSWNYSVNPQRPAHRYWGGIASRDYDLGFRVARDFNSMEGNSK
jgi:formylglycine-generating enzyme required for sulfatase activity